MTLTEFLDARISEDARCGVMLQPHTYECNAWGDEWGPCDCGRNAAECAAKRALLALHEPKPGDFRSDLFCDWCSSGNSEGLSPTAWPCENLLIIAAVYADHRDYDSTWAPNAT